MKPNVLLIMDTDKAYSIPEIASLLEIHIASARARLLRVEDKGYVECDMVKGKAYWSLTEAGVQHAYDLRRLSK